MLPVSLDAYLNGFDEVTEASGDLDLPSMTTFSPPPPKGAAVEPHPTESGKNMGRVSLGNSKIPLGMDLTKKV